MTSLHEANKRIVHAYWTRLDDARDVEIEATLREHFAEGAAWHGPAPIGDLKSVADVAAAFWLPLRESFPDAKRQCHLLIGGASNGRADGRADGRPWVGGTGVFSATFAADYLGIPATGEPVEIRWGEFCRMRNDEIAETFLLIDLVDLMRQAGRQVLPPARGRDGVFPPPAAGDGVLLDARDPAVSAASLDHIRRFIFDGLNAYDEVGLESMGIDRYFHPDIKWYGPGGIGACFGLQEFQTLHQRVWLHAFPDRRVQDLDALIADGAYSGAPGWAGVVATHRGEYLGCPATGRRLVINGLDFWKREGERYVENWVFVDMVHLFRQMGVDLLEQRR